MPQIKMPNGDMVNFPDDMPPDQIKGMIQKKFPASDPTNTRGGDLARGLGHGVMSGLGMGQGAPEGSSGWRQTGEALGQAVPGVAASFLPGGAVVKGGIGAVSGALQPADSMTDRLENAGIGAGSALGLGQIGNLITKARAPLNNLANEAIGSGFGFTHGGGFGGLGGLWAGRNVGHQIQQVFGGRGLADLVAYIAKNPGLASYIGVKASPYAEKAGSYVGNELGKPSQ